MADDESEVDLSVEELEEEFSISLLLSPRLFSALLLSSLLGEHSDSLDLF